MLSAHVTVYYVQILSLGLYSSVHVKKCFDGGVEVESIINEHNGWWRSNLNRAVELVLEHAQVLLSKPPSEPSVLLCGSNRDIDRRTGADQLPRHFMQLEIAGFFLDGDALVVAEIVRVEYHIRRSIVIDNPQGVLAVRRVTIGSDVDLLACLDRSHIRDTATTAYLQLYRLVRPVGDIRRCHCRDVV